jgi:lipoprotein-anchoring transpeptidase ErfK/SrfK
VRVYTHYRVGTSRPRKPRSNRAGVILLFLIAAGIVWIGWHEWKKRAAVRAKLLTPATNRTAVVVTRVPTASVSAADPAKRGQSTNALASSPLTKSAAVLDAQVALDRLGISPGSIDGVFGSQSRAALRAFQLRENIPQTGELDAETRARLFLNSPVLTRWLVSEEDLARLLPISSTWLGKSEQARLDYETILELVAEKTHAHPNLLKRLNPGIVWENVTPGTELIVISTERERPSARAAFLRISLSEKTLKAFDTAGQLIAHFPCSIASRVEKRPVGELYVEVTAPNPNYTFNPEVFPESAEARELGRKLILPPGPNNPVGVAWIGLDKPGYGIHGTPRPEDVGRTESHGCFRLANWNAEYLLQLVTVGTPVRVEP